MRLVNRLKDGESMASLSGSSIFRGRPAARSTQVRAIELSFRSNHGSRSHGRITSYSRPWQAQPEVAAPLGRVNWFAYRNGLRLGRSTLQPAFLRRSRSFFFMLRRLGQQHNPDSFDMDLSRSSLFRVGPFERRILVFLCYIIQQVLAFFKHS
jgi:hypothetical protein